MVLLVYGIMSTQKWKAATDSLLRQLLPAGWKKGPATIRWLTRCNSESPWKCACFDFVSKGVPCKHVIAAVEHDADNESAPSIMDYFRKRWLRSTAKAGVLDYVADNEAGTDNDTDNDARGDDNADNDTDPDDDNDSDASTDDSVSEQQVEAAANECIAKLVLRVGLARAAALFKSLSAATPSAPKLRPGQRRPVVSTTTGGWCRRFGMR